MFKVGDRVMLVKGLPEFWKFKMSLGTEFIIGKIDETDSDGYTPVWIEGENNKYVPMSYIAYPTKLSLTLK